MNHEKIVVDLELDDVLPNRFQPRFKFHEQAITELAESIKEHGVIQPILVRRLGDKYEIIAGERRYKASLLAGKRTIPAIISDLNDKDSAEVALIENVQRQDLTPIEEAVSYRKILDMGYLTQEQLAEKLGKTQSTISNKLRLLNLDDDVQEALLDEKISERHARSLLKIESKQKQKDILEKIIKERLTVKKTDDLINDILAGKITELTETKFETEIPSIFMNNSVQVEEPAIQSSSAIEFINPNDQVINSFENNNKDEELLDFLNIDSPISEQKVVPVEEISEVPLQVPIIDNLEAENFESSDDNSEMKSFGNFDIPTSPIVEEIEEEPIQASPISNNEKELKEINDMIDNLPNINNINPGFVDVDDIEKNAQDIYVERPLADIDNLLMSENGLENNSIKDFNQFDTNNVEEEPIQQNKFFTMLTPEDDEDITDDNKKEISDEETFNFTPLVESNNSLNQFLETESIENDITEQTNNQNEFSFNNSKLEEIKEVPVSNPIIDKGDIDTLNDTYDFQDNIEEIEDTPKVINYPADNILAESVRKEEIMEERNVESVIESKVDLRTVINTIRNCSDTIEKYGFAIECEEYDFEDMYQVIFKIQKNDEK
ncbi:MAG: ParB/RepB/Spo0J family partition protein [Bacilli bacterium]|nr:ParB/RepB/Spo0J family partition protein [Bacilli bacterium]